MKHIHTEKQGRTAFTLVELTALIAIIGLLTFLTIPALAHAKIKSPAAGCLAGMRQLMVGWEMYKEDNNDWLMPNSTVGMVDSAAWVSTRALDYHNAFVNTNRASILNSLMAPYVNNDIRPFRCPADVIPSDNGFRLRSRSMNGQMGLANGVSTYNIGWPRYLKGSDLTCPTPGNAWVFCDESMWSMNDGYLELLLGSPQYPDVPANYHGNACGFSFADGHAEDHRWVMPVLPITNIYTARYLPNVPQQYGFQRTSTQAWGSSAQDADWVWLTQHAACKN